MLYYYLQIFSYVSLKHKVISSVFLSAIYKNHNLKHKQTLIK